MTTEIIPAAQTLPAAVTPMDMIDKALASGASPEALEKLLALQERWEANQAKRAFDTAMAEAKAELPRVLKNKKADFETKTGGRTSYAYETLDALSAAIDPVLHRFGLSYRYSSKVENGQISVTCIVSHSQGHKEETTLQCAPDTSGAKNSVQAIGSATTYLQRYTLKLALGVSASTDDDAKTAAGAPELAMTITADQFQELRDMLEETKDKEADMLAYVGAQAMEDMTLAQYAKAKAVLVKKLAKMKKDAA